MRRHTPILAALALTMLTCHPVLLTAPQGSSIALFANPTFIAAGGGVSIVTALVTRPDGITVADGTVVLFFTNLGHIDEQARTLNGVAFTNLVSDSRSGTATVTAFSGGPATAPATTPTSTTLAASPSPTPAPGGGGTSGTSSQVVILIGNVNATRLQLVADPPRIVQGRPASLTANVFDASGNPVPNVPVIFQIGSTGASPAPTTPFERLGSGGTPQFTDTNGQAFDTIFTKQDPSNPTSTVTVFATTANNVSGSTTVTVN